MKTDQAVALLRQTELFRETAGEILERVSERAVERTFKKGQLIFHQGDRGDALYVVAEGLVKIFVTSEQGDEMVLVTLGRQDTFGELAIVDGGARSASAEVLERTRLLVLTRQTLFDLLREHPPLTDALLRTLGAWLRRLTEQTADLVFLDLHGRVAKLLVGLAEERGRHEEGRIVLDLNVTQTDLAAMVGGSRQSVNQILRAFEKRDYLSIEGRRIVILNADVLRRRAGY